ncbi:HNH endonuclease [Candidatus Parcubacteria bacterium]|nr:HNH endonuclease [Candidatus Parcubacteria bacterium]
MKKNDQRWTKEQTIVAFNLYCKIPFNRVTSSHPEIIKIAKIIGRSVNSVKMKIGNFGSFDPELKKRGIVGLANASKLDEEVWNEFNNNWDDLVFESEKVLTDFEGGDILKRKITAEDDFRIVEGIEKERLVKTRVNQNFFRQTVLSAHDFTCCITGIDIPELLIASHIIPWSKASKDRLNPRNGLSLNALHDKAFDKGLMTITENFKIKISSKILSKPSVPVEKWIASFDGKNMIKPERFVPTIKFLKYHNNNIFKA